MFLPTPRSTMACCSSTNTSGFLRTRLTAFGSHAYRQGKDSCPEIRYCTAYLVQETARSESNFSDGKLASRPALARSGGSASDAPVTSIDIMETRLSRKRESATSRWWDRKIQRSRHRGN